MIAFRILAVTVTLALSLAGCVGRPAKLAPVGAHEILSTDQLEVEWPLEWMTLRPAEKSPIAIKEGVLLLLSQDGFDLQTIQLAKRPQEAEFTHTKKKLSAGMLPQETAEVVLDNMRANPSVADLHLIENTPATVAGTAGFKLNVTYRGTSGLLRQQVVYGCQSKGMLVTLSLDAAKRYYFQRSLPAFERAMNSLHWSAGVEPTASSSRRDGTP